MLRKLSYVALLLLISLGACRKQQPEDFLVPPKTIEKDVKAIGFSQDWFQKQKTTYKEKAMFQRTTTVDSIPFNPMWDYAQVEVLANQNKLVIVPVYRYREVSYNSNVGFLRLLTIQLNPENTIIEGKILEMVAQKTVLPSRGIEIARRYYEHHLEGLANVLAFDLEERVQLTYQPYVGSLRNGARWECENVWRVSNTSMCTISFSNECLGERTYNVDCTIQSNIPSSGGIGGSGDSSVYLETVPDGTAVGGGSYSHLDNGGWTPLVSTINPMSTIHYNGVDIETDYFDPANGGSIVNVSEDALQTIKAIIDDPDYRNMISAYLGNSRSRITIRWSNDKSGGEFDPRTNTLYISQRTMKEEGKIGIVKTMIHEGFHAMLLRPNFDMETNLGLMEGEFLSDNPPTPYNANMLHHNVMASYYRNTAVNILRRFDKGPLGKKDPSVGDDHYLGLFIISLLKGKDPVTGWDDYLVIKYWDRLSQSKRNELYIKREELINIYK